MAINEKSRNLCQSNRLSRDLPGNVVLKGLQRHEAFFYSHFSYGRGPFPADLVWDAENRICGNCCGIATIGADAHRSDESTACGGTQRRRLHLLTRALRVECKLLCSTVASSRRTAQENSALRHVRRLTT